MNLNALTDLISNAVGMLVLFLGITLLQVNQQIYRITVPLEQESAFGPAFFLVQDNAVLPLDTGLLFSSAMTGVALANDEEQAEFLLEQPGLRGTVNSRRGLILHVDSTADWPQISELDRVGSSLQAALDDLIDADRFAFFFVADSPSGKGFSSFRRLRAYLQGQGIAVGWTPTDDDFPAYLCLWSDIPDCRYRPAYR